MAALQKEAQHRAGHDCEKPRTGSKQCQSSASPGYKCFREEFCLQHRPCVIVQPGWPSHVLLSLCHRAGRVTGTSSETLVRCRYRPKFPWSHDQDTVLLRSPFKSGRVVIQKLVFSILPESVSQDDLGKMNIQTQTVFCKSRLVLGRTWDSTFRIGLSVPLKWRYWFR